MKRMFPTSLVGNKISEINSEIFSKSTWSALKNYLFFKFLWYNIERILCSENVCFKLYTNRLVGQSYKFLGNNNRRSKFTTNIAKVRFYRNIWVGNIQFKRQYFRPTYKYLEQALKRNECYDKIRGKVGKECWFTKNNISDQYCCSLITNIMSWNSIHLYIR